MVASRVVVERVQVYALVRASVATFVACGACSLVTVKVNGEPREDVVGSEANGYEFQKPD